MSNKIKDTVEFLSIARLAIAESFKLFEDKQTAKDMIEFIVNEASDYQVMDLLVNQNISEHKYMPETEKLIWAKFQSRIVENVDTLTSDIDIDALHSVLEMEPVGQHGFSSAVPVMEFQVNNGMYKKLKSDMSNFDIDTFIKEHTEKLSSLEESSKQELQEKTAAMAAYDKANPPDEDEDVEKAAAEREAKKAAAKLRVKEKAEAEKAAAEKAEAEKAEAEKAEAEKAAAEKAEAEKAEAEKQYAEDHPISTKIQMLKTLISKASADPMGTIANNPVMAGLAAAAVVTLVGYAGYKTYKKVFSKSTKACASSKGAEKKACLKKFKADALKARMTQLQKGMAVCSKSKDPNTCKAKIKKEMDKLKAKSKKLSESDATIKGFLMVDSILLEEDSPYQKFFKKKLEKWGVNSPSQLDTEKKAAFFKEIKNEWKK